MSNESSLPTSGHESVQARLQSQIDAQAVILGQQEVTIAQQREEIGRLKDQVAQLQSEVSLLELEVADLKTFRSPSKLSSVPDPTKPAPPKPRRERGHLKPISPPDQIQTDDSDQDN